jgi:hypothetical protein
MYLTASERAVFHQAHDAVYRALRQIDQAEGPSFINASYDFVKPRFFVPPKRQPQSERRTNSSENTYRRSA